MTKTRIITLLMLIATAWTGSWAADVMKGYVLLNGNQINAEYTKISNTTVALGSGYNACISQYSQGRVQVPGVVKIGGKNYNVTEVKPLAFRLCNKITFVKFDENITRIGDFACIGCSELKEIELPSTLESVATGAFRDLPKLKSVVCTAATPPVWEYNDVFHTQEGGISSQAEYYIGSSIDLSVPEDYADEYRDAFFSNSTLGWTKAVGWGNFQDINHNYLDDFHTYTYRDLEYLHELLSHETYPQILKITLESDIDMSERPAWTSGLCASITNAFEGEFDGQNHTISGLVVKDETVPYVGLFNYYKGASIHDLKLKDCEFEGKVGVGAVVGFASATYTDVNNVYLDNVIVTGKYRVGGLVGVNSLNSSGIGIRNCVIDGNSIVKWKSGYNDHTDYAVGGFLGFSLNGEVKYCAALGDIFEQRYSETTMGPFVGKAKSNDIPFYSEQMKVVSCYYAGSRFNTYNPTVQDDNITLDSCVIAKRDKFTIEGNANQSTFGDLLSFRNEVLIDNNMKSFFMAGKLGTDHWTYKIGEFPLPSTMEEVWPVEVNVMTLRPKDMPTERVNGLSLVGNVPEQAWYNFATTEGEDRSVYCRDFTATKLWIDEDIKSDPRNYPEHLPLGFANITTTDGEDYWRLLMAQDNGVKYVDVPIFEFDTEKNEYIFDENDQLVETGEYTQAADGRDFSPIGYSLYLPFSMKIPAFCKVYQPKMVTERNDDEIKVVFSQIEGDQIEAFTPYYVVVERDTISLATEAEAICPKVTNGVVALDGIEFVGSSQRLERQEALNQETFILQNDGNWHRVTSTSPLITHVPAFRSYFRLKASTYAQTVVTAFEEDDTPTRVKITTVDSDGTERWFDLSGRMLGGKPTQTGIYYHNMEKVLIR